MTTRWLPLALLATPVVTTAACDDGGSDPAVNEPATSGEAQLNIALASFDLAVGDSQCFLAGLFAPGRNVVLSGEVEMQLHHLGEAGATATPEPVATTTGTFLPVPGKEPAQPLKEPLVPSVGDPAPTVDNQTVDSEGRTVAIDSRAQGEDGEVPDPHLHDTTIATALDQGRPIVVVVSTPTYCVSQFCGPITQTIGELADRYGDAAEFIHLEVWRDFDAGDLNDAAAAWIQTEQGGNEPWVFLVGADSTIQARWDNVLDEAELVEALDGLATQ